MLLFSSRGKESHTTTELTWEVYMGVGRGEITRAAWGLRADRERQRNRQTETERKK